MRRKQQRGVSYIEFGLALLVLVPLLLGVIGLGLSMHRQMQTVQLARDAGHMYARNVDFTLTGNKQVLSQIAGSLGLSTTAGSGTAVVYLSTVRYMDASACSQAGKWTGTPPGGSNNGCINYQKFVVQERIAIGNTTFRNSNVSNPISSIVAADGTVTILNQATAPSAVATMTGFTSAVLGTTTTIFVSEAAATGFRMPPYSGGTNTYAQLSF